MDRAFVGPIIFVLALVLLDLLALRFGADSRTLAADRPDRSPAAPLGSPNHNPDLGRSGGHLVPSLGSDAGGRRLARSGMESGSVRPLAAVIEGQRG